MERHNDKYLYKYRLDLIRTNWTGLPVCCQPLTRLYFTQRISLAVKQTGSELFLPSGTCSISTVLMTLPLKRRYDVNARKLLKKITIVEL